MSNFTAKWETKCDNPACPHGGKIAVGQAMTWNRRGATRIKAHLECYADAMAAIGQESARAETSYTPVAANDGLAAMLAEQIKPHLDGMLKAHLDSAEIERIIDEKLFDKMFPQHIVIEHRASETVRYEGLAHFKFASLLRKCQTRGLDGLYRNFWLHGPAGTGKTKAAEMIAQALGLPYRYTGAIDTQYALQGFIDAQGRIVSTEFRKAYTEGGVFLFDEVDGSSPNATLAFNAALANGHASFPDGNFKRHPDCLVIACANTWGLGATGDYVGRNKLDAAFLDRFAFFEWPIDEALETALCGNIAWAQRVQSVRRAVKAHGIKVLITPRASLGGAVDLAAGEPQDEVEQMWLRKGMTESQWLTVSAGGY